MSRLRPSMTGLSHLHTISVCLLICASFLFAASVVNAQDVAEAARQEKARKAAEAKKQSHVYTNEDLQHSQILTPADRTVAEARKKNSAPPAADETPPPTAPTQDAAAPESLGEIARRVRKESATREAEQARKVPPPAPFSIELPHDTVLAHPKPLSPSLLAPSPARTKQLSPPAPAGSVKRDPFSRAIISATPHSNPVVASKPMRSSISPTALTPPPTVDPPSTMQTAVAVSKSHPESVRVQSGDSLWSLSRQYLGKGSRWQEFLNHNLDIVDPRQIQPGAVLLLPPLDGHSAGPPDAPAALNTKTLQSATISVQPGDSLWKLAAQHLGSGTYWPCLASANPALQNVDLIYPGQNLRLPTSCISTALNSPTN